MNFKAIRELYTHNIIILSCTVAVLRWEWLEKCHIVLYFFFYIMTTKYSKKISVFNILLAMQLAASDQLTVPLAIARGEVYRCGARQIE